MPHRNPPPEQGHRPRHPLVLSRVSSALVVSWTDRPGVELYLGNGQISAGTVLILLQIYHAAINLVFYNLWNQKLKWQMVWAD